MGVDLVYQLSLCLKKIREISFKNHHLYRKERVQSR